MKRIIIVAFIMLVLTLAFSTSAMALRRTGQDNTDNVTAVLSYRAGNGVMGMKDEAQKLVGQTRDQLVTQMGKPQAVYSYKDGGQIYSYRVRLEKTGHGGPHWFYADFFVDASGNVVRVSTST